MNPRGRELPKRARAKFHSIRRRININFRSPFCTLFAYHFWKLFKEAPSKTIYRQNDSKRNNNNTNNRSKYRNDSWEIYEMKRAKRKTKKKNRIKYAKYVYIRIYLCVCVRGERRRNFNHTSIETRLAEKSDHGKPNEIKQISNE